MNHTIALITPLNGSWTYDSYTILDGLMQLQERNRNLVFFVSSEAKDGHPLSTKKYVLPKDQFLEFAKNANLVLLFWCKKNTDFKLAQEINRWSKTVYIDGSELGNNKRYDFTIQRDVLLGSYGGGFGGIDDDMLEKCVLYFRREKPYGEEIIPLPYGITSVYRKHYSVSKKKDIDFFCVWGQDEYPLMRRYVRELLVDFCNENGFTYWINRTKTRNEFYEKLSRSKVGISIGGGGYDTARFWEILGNNCLLMTENTDIFQPDSKELAYQRIYQFNNLYDFQYQLKNVGIFLKKEYTRMNLESEYKNILQTHSSEARAKKVLKESLAKIKINEVNKNLCSVIISSCDAYSDLWEPFFTLFFRYWPDCPFKFYLLSNCKTYADDRVSPILVGKDMGWSLNMRVALNKINTPYFILLHEEFFLHKPVNTSRVLKLLDYIKQEKVACIRLNPAPGPDKSYKASGLVGEMSRGMLYRFALQAAIWDKNVFNSILGDEVKIWDVETNGMTRSDKLDMPFLSVKKPVIHYDPRSAVVRGKFQYKIVKLCKKEGISLDLKKRPINYEIAWREFLDHLRKNPMLFKIKKIPAIAGLFRFAYRFLFDIRISKNPILLKLCKIFLQRP